MSIMRAQLPKELYAGGGITQVRQPYFIGKLVRKVTKPIKKVFKSPIGKVALLGGLGAYGLGAGPFANAPGSGFLGSDFMKRMLLKAPEKGSNVLRDWSLKNISPFKAAALAASAAPFVAPGMDETTTEFAEDVTGRGKFDFDFAEMRTDIAQAVRGGDYDTFKAVLDKYGLVEGVDVNKWGHLRTGASAKDGGRIGMQEGGIMDLGGMEKDYREEGGFVPIGAKEKADDVPARLSVNEFVFTADAVRSAGNGDVDEGAKVMERVMKNLEAGGQISEESQGMKGAQEMFDVSERLSEVV